MRKTKIIQGLGILIIFTGILLNPYFIKWALSFSYIPPSKSALILIYDITTIFLGIFLITKSRFVLSFISKKKYDLLLMLISIILCLFFLEVALRMCIFNKNCQMPSIKVPAYYASPDEDDYWYFHHLFNERWAVDTNYTSKNISDRFSDDVYDDQFYDNWALSLQPDPLLGYSRKPNIKEPCHETTNLATRGLKKHSYNNQNIIFYGDSFVESQACSNNTLPEKIQRKTGIDTLNYGVGGYGFDQAYLLFNRTYKNFNPSKSIFLIGLMYEDLNRMLLEVRSSPKPHFTIKDNSLQLDTSHIDPENLNSYFEKYHPKPRMYIINLLLGKLGIMDARAKYIEKKYFRKRHQLTGLILKEIKKIQEDRRLHLYFVLFYQRKEMNYPSSANHDFLKSQLKENGFEYIDLRGCLVDYRKKTKIPLDEFYQGHPLTNYPGHPSTEGNDVFADCIIKYLKEEGVVKENGKKQIIAW